MAAVSVMGPVGAPMKKPYGSFAGKPMQVVIYSVMGPAGAPMKQPYGGMGGKTPGGVTALHNLPLLATIGKLRSF